MEVQEFIGTRDDIKTRIDAAHLSLHRAVPSTMSQSEVISLLDDNNAFLVAHLYTPPQIQDIAIESGGIVSDSLDMAKAGAQTSHDTLVVAGVRFMGETAKILNMDKRVLVPDINAQCSLDLGCPADEFGQFCDSHPDRTVVVYANTSVEVKARADWVVTSTIALDVVEHLTEQGHKLLWGPDKHLGRYIQEKTGADMIMWDGACIVHEEFRADGIAAMKNVHANAGVLAHPESPYPVLAMADFVGSTTQLLKAAESLDHEKFIVATDAGVFHAMRRRVPHKTFIRAPTAGEGGTCRSCAYCPWMKLNHQSALENVFDNPENEIRIEPALAQAALKPLNRMVSFKHSQTQ